MKRIVLLDPDGIPTIMGVQDEPLPTILSVPFEDEVTPENPTGLKMLVFNLIKVRTRFALYRPVPIPATSTFNDTFNPRQV